MRHVKLTTLTLGVLALSAAVAFAQSAKPAVPAQRAPRPAPAAQSARPAAMREMALSGTIAAYDAAANTLTVKTDAGDRNVLLEKRTRIHEGSKSVKATDLAGLSGHTVKVRYRESNGKLLAESITVAPAAAK